MVMTVEQAASTIAGNSWAVPAPLAPPAGTSIGLRRPLDRFALRSSFSSIPLTCLPGVGVGVGVRPRFSMRVASKQSYICRDCGYIYSDRKPFDKLPDSYFCPVCGAPKRRFRAYEPTVSKNANELDVRKARKAQLKRDEAIGQALPIAIVVGIALLGAVYLYLNNTL
ncbi:hypothetical protein RND81_02G044300 [Saponaria officinalis]|uniref:Rubredoxin-like domain-containing protein n=1 Tax=Saponaria officinalis TaxID=3572 RepID=A0AAW1MQW3_SAPOF